MSSSAWEQISGSLAERRPLGGARHLQHLGWTCKAGPLGANLQPIPPLGGRQA
eukprot:CAMPEP_0115314270 /NCGR_PEP_ID=MMETSP0270-20121206/76943_1 /TAXON_ID=71861 /ORGANISM="Scrippsiella trochoidea, Strain CCMP3099" /LENGTH=52 /DNA_ID=CAMNT_0002733485 /DNA_START=62 /DNA_END=216 /DNA_ORIENTATION=-